MYKIFRGILIVVAVLMLQTVCVSANSEYTISDDMITGYNGNADVVVIPAIIDGVDVAGIETKAFENKDMHTVIIEEGIEVIQPKAFVGCENLQYVKSPESMLLINENAFFECNPWLEIDAGEETYIMGEQTAVMLLETEGDSESETGDTTTGGTTTGGEETIEFLYSGNTITGYTGVDTDIIIPDSIDGVTITTIGNRAFNDNTAITSVIIPETVSTIGDYAFKGCTSLAQVSLPKQLSTVGTDAFMNCTSLEKITVPGSLKRISKNMFYGCSNLTEVVLEEGIQNTGSYAFYNCNTLESISIPSTLKNVSAWSFGYCYVLQGFDIPEGVTGIGSAAFYGCKKISSIIMPDTVTSIETHAFRGCKGITNMILSENIDRISYRALNGCGFSEIKIPENVVYIDDESFYQCQKLTSIEIPDGVVSIGKKAFYGCFRMTECIIYSEDVTFGADVFYSVADGCKIWVPENSNTLASAEENGITYVLIEENASVTDQEIIVNGNLISADTPVTIKSGDTISVKYRIITADDSGIELLFAFLRFDEDEKFLGLKTVDTNPLNNSQNILEDSFLVTDENQVKVILFNSIQEFTPLCPAKEFKGE